MALRANKDLLDELIDVLRSLNHSDEEIKTIIMGKYDLSEEAAEKYL